MSTGYYNNKEAKISALIQTGEQLFHVKELAFLWGIKNSDTLYTTVKRFNRNKLLYRIYKGLYSLIPVEKINPVLLGVKALHQFAYISTETVLFQNGLLSQALPYITMISSKSIRFKVHKYLYISRQLKSEFLYQQQGVENHNGIMIASIERAVADLLYFNPNATIDGRKLVNWKKVNKLQKEIGYNVND